MDIRTAGRMHVRNQAQKYIAPANLSQRCLLCIVGVLGGFMALVQGMIIVQGLLVTNSDEMIAYWVISLLGIWLPAIAIFASIVGVMIRDKSAMVLLVLSPLASMGGYAFYTFGPGANLF